MGRILVLFYHALFLVAYPFLILRHLTDFLHHKRRDQARQKLGWFTPGGADLWIHAVSAGEVLLTRSLLSLLPDIGRVFITCQSATGMEALKKLYAGSPRVGFSYLPYDFWPVLHRIIGKLSPKSLIVIEHDLWPGLLQIAGKKGVRRILVNAFFKPRDLGILKIFPWAAGLIYNLDLILSQNAESQKIARTLTRGKIPVHEAGNLKVLPPPAVPPLGLTLARPATVTLGSSHEGEEELAVNALRERLASQNVLLVLIPRHPGRAREIAGMFPENKILLWSELTAVPEKNIPMEVDILIVDEMGLSLSFYQKSSLVLIGDTFRPTQGGHNFLEPIFFQKPVIYGSRMISFSDLTPIFEKVGAVRRVHPSDLKKNLEELLANPELGRIMGEKAFKILEDLKFRRDLFTEAVLAGKKIPDRFIEETGNPSTQ